MANEEPDPDLHSLENEPPWPAGRTNHSGVGLNRDWAWATQPETRARIAALRTLPPQVYVDVHEMGPDQSYFFPPPAEPVPPRIPETTRRWIEASGKANAEAFDAHGWSYFNREVFDECVLVTDVDPSSTVSGIAVLGGVERTCNSQDFRGGELMAFMGGCVVDLHNADMKVGEVVIQTFAFWGGVEIKVPEDWSVSVQGFPILSGSPVTCIDPPSAATTMSALA